MKKILPALLLVLMPSLSQAKIDVKKIDVVHIKADSVIYQKNTESYSASGNCLIYTDEYSLKSDKAYFNKNTSIVTLSGNILFSNKSGDWIRGSNAAFNTLTYKGYINNAVMFIKDSHLYVKAKQIVMNGKDRYYIDNAMATGCKCDKYKLGSSKYHPKWSIRTKHIYIVKDKYLLAYPTVFKIKQIPVFFSPALYKSLAKKRKTGLLFPSVGHSSKDGFKYAQPFFWAIDKSKDITITPFIYSTSGFGMHIDSRFYLTRNSKGKWHITLFKEKIPYGASKHNKYRLTLDIKQLAQFNKYGDLKYNINIVNDKNNFRVLDKDNMDKSSKKYTKSILSYFIEKGEYSFGISSYFYQDLVAENNRKTLQKLPQININIINKKIWKNLTLDIESTTENNYRVDGIRGYSNDTHLFLSYPSSVFHFNIIPKIGAYNIYAKWKNTQNGKNYSKNILMPEYSIDIKTMLNGFYLTNNNIGLSGIKHSISPTISYKYIPKRKWDEFPDFISTYDKQNAIVATLENRIIAKYINKKSISYREIFYNKLAQEYDFYKEKEKGTYFPAIYEETRISPFDFLYISSKAHYSTRKHTFTDMDNTVSLHSKESGASLGYLLKRDEDYKKTDENIKVNIYTKPINSLYLYAYLERNIQDHYYPQKKIGFMYTEDCWGIGLDMYENQTPKEDENGNYHRRKDTGFWITLTFKGLGQIKTQNKQWTSQE
jgi:LPS-assembly protein